MRRRAGAAVLLVTSAAVSAGGVAACGAGGASSRSAAAATREPLRFEQHELYIEYNATDGDAGLQLAADAEDWKRFELLDTKGKSLIDVHASGRLRRPFGLSELFLEASEPSFTKVPFETFKKRFPRAATASVEWQATAAGWSNRTGCPSWSQPRPT
jgi:hypothetical protein